LSKDKSRCVHPIRAREAAMSTEQESNRSSNRTVWLVVGLVGGVVLILLVVCGGLGFFAIKAVKDLGTTMQQMVRDVQLSQSTAESFIAELAADHLADAYERTTDGYRERVSLDELRKFVEKNSFLKKQSSSGVNTLSF